MSAPFAYDAVAYPTVPMRQCHPDRLNVVGRLFGLTPPPVETCRVLDIGCGTGTHLIAAGLALPGARFVGLDLSETAIRHGRTIAAAAGVTNVELLHADLLAFEPGPGSFDYVTAHGFYSWVPPEVRDRFLAVAAAALAPTGLGYASYNAYPGCHVRRMFWDMMRFHIPDGADPVERVARVRSLAEFLAAGQAARPDEVSARIIKKETDRLISEAHPGSIYHDDLAEVNDPVYVTEFAEHLARHGLRFVAEADVFTMHEGAFPPPVAAALAQMRAKDVVWKEQYIDFLLLRRFRQTVFGRADLRPSDAPRAAAVAGFAVAMTDRLAAEHADLTAGVKMTFRSATDKGSMTLDEPLAKAAMLELVGRWPGRVAFAELAERAAARAGVPLDDARRAGLCRVLLAAGLSGPVEFFAHVPRYAAAPGPRPTASPLARVQALDSSKVATLLHTTLDLEDAANRQLLMLLDGTRDRAAVVAGLRERVPELADEGGLAERVEGMLARLAVVGLLTADDRR